MKPKTFIITLIFTTITGIFSLHAQCLDFVKTKGFQILDTDKHVPEGRFDSMILSEGDNLTVYKSFFRGKKYRLVVLGADDLPKLKYKVKTMSGDVIYDNNTDGKTYWDYTSDRNQNLVISIEIPPNTGSQPKSACVAVIMGYKMN
jgi:hypothetical protein